MIIIDLNSYNYIGSEDCPKENAMSYYEDNNYKELITQLDNIILTDKSN